MLKSGLHVGLRLVVLSVERWRGQRHQRNGEHDSEMGETSHVPSCWDAGRKLVEAAVRCQPDTIQKVLKVELRMSLSRIEQIHHRAVIAQWGATTEVCYCREYIFESSAFRGN